MNILKGLAFGTRCSNRLIWENVITNINGNRIKQPSRTYLGETYEGSGKTTAYLVNKRGTKVICIEYISVNGFRLTNGWQVMGPTILFPHTLLSWKINSLNDITEESMALFKILQPKVDVLFLGYGSKGDISYTKIKNIVDIFRRMKINFEIMPTEDAASTFNFCSLDKRYVAAALIPPSQITYHHDLSTVDLRDDLKVQLV